MPLPHGSSHWDKLPNEIKEMIFEHASLLRPFLDGRLKLDSYKGLDAIRLIWVETFDIDWQGDLRRLPTPREYPKLRNIDLSRVKSRSMYERLCQRFPGATEANAGFAETDKDIEEHKNSTHAIIPHSYEILLHGPLRLLHIPMRHMWLDLLGDTLDDFPYARAQECIIEGYTDMLRLLVDSRRVDLSQIKLLRRKLSSETRCFYPMDVAAGGGHLDIVKMLHETGCQEASTKAMDDAACNGYLDIIKWLHENRTEGCTTAAMDDAARCGHINVVKWLHENRTEGCTSDAMDQASYRGHFNVVKWLHENRAEGCTTRAMDYAAWKGHLDIIKLLYENRTEGCTTKAMDRTTRYGYLNVVKWLHENRSEGCTTDAMDSAASGGHLEVVKWLHENRTEGCTTKAIDEAAIHNHLNVVRFLLENRSERFTDAAIIHCESNVIANLLVSKMSFERRRYILEDYRRWGWSGPGIDAIKRSFRRSQK